MIKGTGVFADATLYNTEVTDLSNGDNTFIWTVSNGTCSANASVTIHVDAAVSASTTPIAAQCGIYTATLTGNDPAPGTGLWTTTSGATITNPTAFNSGVTGLSNGDNVFTWTVTNGTCSEFATLTIHVNSLPTIVVSKVDATWASAIDGSVTMTPTSSGTYRYTLNPGGLSSGDQTIAYTFSNLTAGNYNWTMTDVNTMCSISGSITVGQPASIPLSGTVNYYNAAHTLLNNVVVKLNQAGSTVQTTTTDGSGAYLFNNVRPGTYDVVMATLKDMGGINSTDAGQVNAWNVLQISGVHPEIEKVRFLSGDVTGDLVNNSPDAAAIQQYFLTVGTSPVFDKPWEFWKAGDMVTTQQNSADNVMHISIPAQSSPVTQNFLGLVSGDFNQSFTPSNLKSAGGRSNSLTLIKGESIEVLPVSTIDLPVKAGSAMQVGAISLILNYPVDKLQVEGVFMKGDTNQPIQFNTINGELRIAWNSLNPISLAKGETMLTVRLKTKSSLTAGEVCRFELAANLLNELADGGFDIIQNASLIMDGLQMKNGVTAAIDIPVHSAQLLMTSYPNPFRENANIKYTLPEAGQVYLEITSILGNRIRLLSNQQQAEGEYSMSLDGSKLVPGVYMITLRLTNQYGSEFTKTIRMVKQ